MRNLLFIIILIQAGRVAAQNLPEFAIRPNSKSVIRIVYRNNSQTRPIFSFVGSVLPFNKETRIEDSIQAGSGEKQLVYELAAPQTGLLTINQRGGFIYFVPNDTLIISMDLSKSDPWVSYQFIGQYATLNQYYFAQVNVLKGVPFAIRAHLANESASLMDYRKQMDTLLRAELQFLLTYHEQHKLPDWFLQKERQRIIYSDASARANAVGYRQFIKKDKPNDRPKDYFSFVTPALLNSPSNAYLLDYQYFLKDYFYYLFNQQKLNKNVANYTAKLASKHLKGLAWDVFMTRYLDELLAGAPTTGEQMLATYYSRFTNKEWIDNRKAYYQDAYLLKPGELAPNFALEDKLDSLTYLNDFKGQVIYLSFWFTGCAPCRQEMPFENKLVDYFAGKPVKIVNICVQSSRPDWIKVSKLYNLKTINLYANKAWEKTLIEKYNVKTYPHYVLINQEGKVVKNNCDRPSENARQAIESLLNE